MKSADKGGFEIKHLTAILFVIVAVGTVAVVLSGDDIEPEASADTSQGEAPETNETTMPAEGVVAPVDQEEATLEAVGAYTGSATATRSFEGGEFLHELIANLGDPAEGKFYEGWLVGETVVSTGRLESEEEGVWSLVYSSDVNLTSHDQIVVTEETEANGLDGNPEAHVLEGSF